jgi:hypothetical protein
MKLLGIVAAIVVTVFVPPSAQDSGQATTCAALNWSALQSNDPAYADALDLTRALADRGFVVQCVAPSKMTGTFEAQVGAALYKTNEGEFEALFLPKAQDFEGLQVIERQERGRYLYSFAGRPKPLPATLIDSARRTYFIKNLNRLLVADDEALAARLRSTLIG